MTNITLIAEHKRYFKNIFSEQLADKITTKWIKSKIDLLLSYLKTAPYETKGGVYNGSGGIAYAFFRVAVVIKRPENLYTLCYQLLDYNLSCSKIVSNSKRARYLNGTFGLYVIKALISCLLGNNIDFISVFCKDLLNTIVTPGYQQIGDDEILNGRAGFLMGIFFLRINCNVEVISDSEIKNILSAIIQSGREYSLKNQSKANLMFQWHGSEYLGAAHGISGIYHVLLNFWNLLTKIEKDQVKQSIDWLLSLQTENGNFPSSSSNINIDKGENELVHWCHGATGVIQMLVSAFITLGDHKYLKAAEKCAQLIWEKGILRKGPGICHGLAGGGYAFLLLYRLTSDIKYLNRAKVFALIMMNPDFKHLSQTPDSPYSLFEGWAGSLCFLVDLYLPLNAQFPLIPIKFN